MSAEPEVPTAGQTIGVVDPVAKAVNTVGRTLFQGAGSGQWLALGLCAFLVALGSGGAGIYEQAGGVITQVVGFVPFDMRPEMLDPNRHAPQAPREVLQKRIDDWRAQVRKHADKYVAFGVVVTALFIPLWLAFQWLGARGRFMFIDNLVHHRALVKQPWSEFRREANSLFVLNVLLTAVVAPVKAAIPAAMVWAAWPDIAAKSFGNDAKRSLYIGIPALLAWGLISHVLSFAGGELLPPIMYRRRVGWFAACGVFRQNILAKCWGRFLMCFLFYILLQTGAGAVMSTFNCVTCCAGSWPYVQQVITLPVSVFMQAYFLHYLEQFGPEWKFFLEPVTAEAVE